MNLFIALFDGTAKTQQEHFTKPNFGSTPNSSGFGGFGSTGFTSSADSVD